MEFNIFKQKIEKMCSKINITINEESSKKLYEYMQLLIEWNEKVNLTSIIEPDEIIVKHFLDSLTIAKYINKNNAAIDIGTGAGFPGIPLGIVCNCNVTLVDSLQKRINFLQEVKSKIKLDNSICIHSRAEEFSQNSEYREKFDIAVSRAVANMSVLSEYLLPTLKINGIAIFMKGPNIDKEIEDSKTAIKELGGKIKEISKFNLPDTDISRTIIIVEKIKGTPKKYPRKAGTPAKEPIGLFHT